MGRHSDGDGDVVFDKILDSLIHCDAGCVDIDRFITSGLQQRQHQNIEFVSSSENV